MVSTEEADQGLQAEAPSRVKMGKTRSANFAQKPALAIAA